jgi:serine protease Do
VVTREPELDVALVKIDKAGLDLEDYFDVAEAAKKPVMEPGTGILAFSNQFQIATRDEPMSVQRGVISAHSKLAGRIGVFEAQYRGPVYVLDAITNNPGAGGGAITTRKGELLGLIGRELRNEQTNTWINYAVPINALVEVTLDNDKKRMVGILDVVRENYKYKPGKPRPKVNFTVYTGITLVPNVVERTPPYVEEVVPGSPADKPDKEKNKLQPDDLIVYLDGLPAPDINTFNQILATYSPNSEVKVDVQRGDKLVTVTIKLAKPAEKPKK